jgi:hypothetical protein
MTGTLGIIFEIRKTRPQFHAQEHYTRETARPHQPKVVYRVVFRERSEVIVCNATEIAFVITNEKHPSATHYFSADLSQMVEADIYVSTRIE